MGIENKEVSVKISFNEYTGVMYRENGSNIVELLSPKELYNGVIEQEQAHHL